MNERPNQSPIHIYLYETARRLKDGLPVNPNEMIVMSRICRHCHGLGVLPEQIDDANGGYCIYCNGLGYNGQL